MTKRLMQHATKHAAPAVAMVGKSKTPRKLVDRMQTLDIAAKVGGPPPISPDGLRRVVRRLSAS